MLEIGFYQRNFGRKGKRKTTVGGCLSIPTAVWDPTVEEIRVATWYQLRRGARFILEKLHSIDVTRLSLKLSCLDILTCFLSDPSGL